MTYAEQAAQFEAAHGFPAPPEDVMAHNEGWPFPFCAECADWHFADELHSTVLEGWTT